MASNFFITHIQPKGSVNHDRYEWGLENSSGDVVFVAKRTELSEDDCRTKISQLKACTTKYTKVEVRD